MPGRPGGADEFGSGLASGDFDRDGAADLAIGAPGRNRVSVLFGTGHGRSRRAPDAARAVGAERLRLRPRRTRHGRGRLRRPARRRARERARSAATCTPPRRAGRLERPPRADPRAAGVAAVGFGTRLRLGDVDGDHHVDLVEGGPPGRRGRPRDVLPRVALRPAPLPGVRRGPTAPRASRSATSTTTATRTSSRATPRPTSRWRRRRGPAVARQPPRAAAGADPHRPGHARDPGEERAGRPVRDDRGDRRPRPDGYADMIVAATGENDKAGRITVIRGARTATRASATPGSTRASRRCPAPAGRGRIRVDARRAQPHRRPAAGPRGGGARRATRRLARDGGGERPRRVRARRAAHDDAVRRGERGSACRWAPGSGSRALRRLTAGGAGFTLLMAVPAPGRRRRLVALPKEPRRAGHRRPAAPGAAEHVEAEGPSRGCPVARAVLRLRRRRAPARAVPKVTILLVHAWGMGGTIRTMLTVAGVARPAARGRGAERVADAREAVLRVPARRDGHGRRRPPARRRRADREAAAAAARRLLFPGDRTHRQMTLWSDVQLVRHLRARAPTS